MFHRIYDISFIVHIQIPSIIRQLNIIRVIELKIMFFSVS